MPVCHIKRAYFSQNFHGEASYDYCATKEEKHYGFKDHLVVIVPGMIITSTVIQANADEKDVLPEGHIPNLWVEFIVFYIRIIVILLLIHHET